MRLWELPPNPSISISLASTGLTVSRGQACRDTSGVGMQPQTLGLLAEP